MVQKRPFCDHEGDGRYSKRKPLLRTVVEELSRGPSLNEAWWEDFFRRSVREEVEKAINRHFNISPCSYPYHQASQSGDRNCPQLKFNNKLPPQVFTGNRIEPEDPLHVLQIILFDPVSQSIVTTGPLSSAKVEIVALDGDFNQEDFTEQHFNNNVLKEREGKRPLVTGELTLTLNEGVGYVTNVVFTDNSSWRRSRTFRLGARLLQSLPGQERVREARSEPFVVKDQRGEQYKKHHPPCLKDEVWRLEKIAKDGAFHNRLSASGISNVQEFLQLCITNPSALREVLGGVSNRIWSAIVDHAKKCVVDDNKFFAFHRPDLDAIVFFDSIYNVIGAIFDGAYLAVDLLSPSQKIQVESLKQFVYSNTSVLIPVEGLTIPTLTRPIAGPSNLPPPEIQYDITVFPYDQQAQTLVPLPAPQATNQFLFFPQTNRMSSFSFEDFNIEMGSSSQMPVPENVFHFQASAWNEQRTGLEERFFPTKAKWSKVRTAFKCLMSVKHAARKIGRPPLHLTY